MGGGGPVDLIRDGQHQTIDLPTALIGKLVERKKNSSVLFMPRVPVIVDLVPDTSKAFKAGLKHLDQITTVEGISTPFYEEYKKAIDAHKGQSVALTVERKGTIDTLHANVNLDGTLGFYRLGDPEVMDSLGLIKIEKTEFGFFASFPAGVHMAVEKLRSYISQFKKILSPKTEAYKGVGGFKAMGKWIP